jgi:hypothetical protein
MLVGNITVVPKVHSTVVVVVLLLLLLLLLLHSIHTVVGCRL